MNRTFKLGRIGSGKVMFSQNQTYLSVARLGRSFNHPKVGNWVIVG